MAKAKRNPSAKKKPGTTAKRPRSAKAPPAKYPRHAVDKALRIPTAILEQNAGKECTVKESAAFLGVGSEGPYEVEVSSGIKYGFLVRPSAGRIAITGRAKRVLRPQNPQDKISGLREAITEAPVFSDVYGHYRGENLPDDQFLQNALIDKFKVPGDKVAEFMEVLLASLRTTDLLVEHDDKLRVVDVSGATNAPGDETPTLRKLERSVKVAGYRHLLHDDAVRGTAWRLL